VIQIKGGPRRDRAGSSRSGTRSAVIVPLLPPTLSYVVLTLAAVAVPGLMAGVRPWTSDSAQLDFFQHHGAAVHASAFFTFGAAIPFAILTAVSTTRLRTLGLDVPGRMIAFIGGTVAAVLLAVSGLTTLALAGPHVAESDAVLRAGYGLTFATGGLGFVVFSGLLFAGLSITGLIGHVLPRAIAWLGVTLAAVCELASVAVALPGLDLLVPIGRFGGLLWLLAIAVTLPATRRQLRERRHEVRAADLS
jgi:hypothetical protein